MSNQSSSRGMKTEQINPNLLLIANCFNLNYSENHFPLFNAITQIISSMNFSEGFEVQRFLCNNNLNLIYLGEVSTWGSNDVTNLLEIIGFLIEKNEENFYLWFISQQYLLITDPVKLLLNCNSLYEKAKEKLMSFDNRELDDVIFFMDKISLATSIISQKVDGLKYVRSLPEFN
jgi:hypothetical protein